MKITVRIKNYDLIYKASSEFYEEGLQKVIRINQENKYDDHFLEALMMLKYFYPKTKNYELSFSKKACYSSFLNSWISFKGKEH